MPQHFYAILAEMEVRNSIVQTLLKQKDEINVQDLYPICF